MVKNNFNENMPDYLKESIKIIASLAVSLVLFLLSSFFMNFIQPLLGQSEISTFIFPFYIFSLFFISPCLLYIVVFSRTKLSISPYIILVLLYLVFTNLSSVAQGWIIFGGICFLFSIIITVVHTIVIIVWKLITKQKLTE